MSAQNLAAVLPAPLTRVRRLPAELNRLLALEAALLAGLLTVWIGGIPGIPWLGVAAVMVGILFLFVPLVLGFPGSVILAAAVLSNIGGVLGAFLQYSPEIIVLPALTGLKLLSLTLLSLILWLTFQCVRSASLFGIYTGFLFVCLALLGWMGLSTAGAALMANAQVFSLAWSAATLVFVLSLALNRWEARQALRRAARLAAWRDGLVCWAGLLAATAAALKSATWTSGFAARAFFGGPLEGSVASIGYIAGIVTWLILSYGVAQLPSWAERGQLAGRHAPCAVGESLWFAALALSGAVAAEILILAPASQGSFPNGLASWVALCAAGGFALTRLVFSAPAPPWSWPLWIAIPNPVSAATRRYLARLAAAWPDGPVTVVAAPEAAWKLRGVHLRLSANYRNLAWLFPRNRVQLADWEETLPPASDWAALPVRELYAHPDLWPELLSKRLDAGSQCVVVADHENGSADSPLLRSLVEQLPPARTQLHVRGYGGDLSDLSGRWPLVRVENADALAGRHLAEWVARMNKQRAHEGVALRYILIVHKSSERDFAQALAAQIDGQRDAHSRQIQATAIGFDTGPLVGRWFANLPPRFWQFSLVMISRLIEKKRATKQAWLLFSLIEALAKRSHGEHEVVVIEPGTTLSPEYSRGATLLTLKLTFNLHPPAQLSPEYSHGATLLTAAAREGTADRVIGILPAHSQARFELALPENLYAGVVTRSAAASVKADAEQVARRLLMLDLDSVTTVHAAIEPAAHAAVSAPSGRPEETPVAPQGLKIFLSLTRDLENYRESLFGALQVLKDIEVRSGGAASLNVSLLLEDIKSCDVFVGIYGWEYGYQPPGSNVSLTEMEYRTAQASEKPCVIFLQAGKQTKQTAAAQRMQAWRRELHDRHLAEAFENPTELSEKLLHAIQDIVARYGGKRWAVASSSFTR